jgi:hypothetical protein
MPSTEHERSDLRERAQSMLGALSAAEREALLIKCWMSHDARWFNAVAMNFGLEAANRLNQQAAHDVGVAEARRMARACGLPVPAATVDDNMLVMETIIGLMGPDLLDYQSVQTGEDTFEVRVERCFAYDQVDRVGVAAGYDCGIFARVGGWFEALEADYEMTPPLEKCLKARGQPCVHAFRIKGPKAAT